MKRFLSTLSILTLFITSSPNAEASILKPKKDIKVKNLAELRSAIKSSSAGDNIILANGTWKDAEIKFYGKGTKENPIVLKAETPGKVFIEGVSNLKLAGS